MTGAPMADLDWMDDAACTQVDAEIFFPDQGAFPTASKALHICRSHCPVRAKCFAYAQEQADTWMVMGGEHWVRGRQGVKVATYTSPSRRGCPICLVAG